MKTPQEKKAEGLVSKFKDYADENYQDTKYQHELNETRKYNAIQCAKIAVEEIIKVLELASDPYSTLFAIDYWQEVLECLNKM